MLVACLALAVALTGPAWGDPVAHTAASLGKNVKKALKLGKKADRRSKKALKTAKQALAKGGPQGPRGPQGPKGDTGATGARGSDLTAVCKGNSTGDVMVKAGSICIDRYEASIWTAPTGGTQITGALPCNANGQDCQGKIFARSVAGVAPRAGLTWFQAQQALANSGKRLPTNAEWQAAVAGTPDSTACNVSTGSVANTGANAGCISSWGANDMVGNLWEWVADWDEQANDCDNWPATDYGSDLTCVGGAPGGASTTDNFPGALIRGGSTVIGTDAGPFAVLGSAQPSLSSDFIGLRGAS